MIGQTISHYKILDKLGEGGMGVVYKAQDLKLDRLVALKFLPPHLAADEDDKKRFIHEGKAASSLDHPNICNVHEVDETPNGQLFIAMAIYDGASLSKKIEKSPLKIEEALDIATQVAEGLQAAHEKGITHRDIKSSNVIVTEKGRAIIMDFGLARSAGATQLTKTGSTLGTVPYMSPEQARGEKVDHRSDIWSLGAVIYEMVTGQLPFRSQYNEAIIYSILNESPQPITALRSGVPMELERIVKKCLEKNPADRYQHAEELIVDLRKVKGQAGKDVFAFKPNLLVRSKSFIYGGAVIVLGLLVLLALPLLKGKEESIHSIAVLPLENFSRDPEQEYFADGMTEALITDLAKISALRVISRTSVMHFKATQKTAPEIAKELNVDAIVVGSVQRVGDRVRITAQLLHAPTDRHLWAESYERNLTDVLALQSEVALAIAKEIRAKVTPQEEARFTSAHPIKREPYEAYLLGRFHLRSLNEQDLEQAINQFERAIQLAPDDAAAYAGLSNAWLERGIWGAKTHREVESPARTAALKAVELDAQLSEAHASLSTIKFVYDWDWGGAENGFKRALDIDPGNLDVHTQYAYLLMALGRHTEAVSEMHTAEQLDPLSSQTQADYGRVLYRARKYEDAISHLKRAIELEGRNYSAYGRLGDVYAILNRYNEAIAAFEKARELRSDEGMYLARIARVYALMGRRREALKLIKRMNALAFDIASVFAALGNKDESFKILEKAIQERSSLVVYFKEDPNLDILKSDPRWEGLIKKMKFETSEPSKNNTFSDIETRNTAVSPKWQNSIAVLPFKNISSDKEQEYFCDGMTEQLITNLTNLPNVKVIARTSVMQFKNTEKTIQQIAQELDVVHVLEGSVRKAGNKIRVTAQLIKAEDGFHLWAKDYDRQLKDIFTVQDDVSNAIVQALKVKLPVSLQHSMVATAPKNSEAYDLYLRGNFFLHKSDQESLIRALDYFQKSIQKDRSYAPPYAGVAYAYATLADAYLPPKDTYPKAKSAAVKALELDSTIAEARAALAFILGAYERDQLSSQREFRRAMEFNPNSVDVLWLSALYLGFRTGSAEAIALADRAIALDPLNPSASWTKENVLLQARQYDEAIEQHKRTVELDPNFFYADSPVSRAYREKGMLKEALDEYMKVQKLMPEQPLYGLAILYAHIGRQQEARNILSDLINESTKRYIAPTGPAMVYISLGELDRAFEWLDRAYEAHDTFLNGLKTDGRYDPIHSDPRYTVLLKKLGFEK